jgi:predicted nucleic acid-binding Zn ribbon protein
VTNPCPACGEPIGPDDGFCEACGAELAPAAVSSGTADGARECPLCAADGRASAEVSPEGYCEICGRKVPSGRDREELDVGPAAGVTDRGLRHARNEDAMALAAVRVSGGPVALAVVCDGVSSAPRPDEASLSAVQAAAGSLLSAIRAGDDPAAASGAAARAAGRAVGALGVGSGRRHRRDGVLAR